MEVTSERLNSPFMSESLAVDGLPRVDSSQVIDTVAVTLLNGYEVLCSKVRDKSVWEALWHEHFAEKKLECTPIAFVTGDGRIYLRSDDEVTPEEQIEGLVHELEHLELGFPKKSGRNEFMVALYTSARMVTAGFPGRSAEEILAEVLAQYRFEPEVQAHALRSAKEIVHNLNLEEALHLANGGRRAFELPAAAENQISYSSDSNSHQSSKLKAAAAFSKLRQLFMSKEERARQTENQRISDEYDRLEGIRAIDEHISALNASIGQATKLAAEARSQGNRAMYGEYREKAARALQSRDRWRLLRMRLEGTDLPDSKMPGMEKVQRAIQVVTKRLKEKDGMGSLTPLLEGLTKAEMISSLYGTQLPNPGPSVLGNGREEQVGDEFYSQVDVLIESEIAASNQVESREIQRLQRQMEELDGRDVSEGRA